MAVVASQNGRINGETTPMATSYRFSDIPAAIDIPVTGGDIDEAVEVNLEDQLDDPTELCQLLDNEKAAKNLWITIALAYAKQGQLDHAYDILEKGLASLARSGPKERLSLLCCIAWLDIYKSRRAPRVASDGATGQDIKTKDHHLREATAHVNDALRINPAFPPLHLTRGVLNLLRASLSGSTKTGPAMEAERRESLRQAQKCFEDAIQASGARNMMAVMGKARALYLQGKVTEALSSYQTVLQRMPTMMDPDPRIGIGCCFWRLGYPENARQAWERSLFLNPRSKVALSLLGVFYMHEAGKHAPGSEKFKELYQNAVKLYFQKAHVLDKKFAFNCAHFANYFLATKRYDAMESLARTAIEQTDVNAIASDGWFLIAKKAHEQRDFPRANDAYNKADQARGGMDKGYWPAKFGMTQLMIQGEDRDGAKFRLEKAGPQHSRSIETMTLLGCIYADEAFAAQKVGSKEDKTVETRKAIALLENVRRMRKDVKVHLDADDSVLVYLTRLYEKENATEAMKCLLELQELQSNRIPPQEKPAADDPEFASKLREFLPPDLLNNLGCFYFDSQLLDHASEFFQSALNAVLKLNEKQEADKRAVEEGNLSVDELDLTDTDAMVTSISYNLARTYEAQGLREEASKVYEGLLKRHDDYTEAVARLAFMALQDSPQDQGPRKISAVYQTDYGNTEIRALMGWYYHSSKRKTMNIAEDQENRHYKHTLQGYDKHDLYSLVGMGNIHLNVARDMPRNNDSERDKRTKMYQKAIEFFDKALQLDVKNAYAAQGIAIALCDDKRSHADALQIFSRVKDTVRDTSVFVNLGHVYAELRQFQRSIDNYNIALARDGGDNSTNAQLLACLSRVWLLKGKNEKSIDALNKSLQYMERALETQVDSPHLQFNVAFIQFQIVQLVNTLPEAARSLEDVEKAADGLEAAIATFETVAKAKNPPYPRSALEQRAAMSKGTMRKQLERSHEKQSDYERQNATRLAESRALQAERKKQQAEAAQAKIEAEAQRAQKMVAEREEIAKKTAELNEKHRAEAMAREAADWTEDSENGERIKRSMKKKAKGGRGRKRDRDDDGFIEDDEADADGEAFVDRTPLASENEASGDEGSRIERSQKGEEPRKKKRRLERKGGRKIATAEKPGKFKSAAVVVDSDSDEEPVVATPPDTPDAELMTDVAMAADDGEDGAVKHKGAPRKRKQLRTIADDDNDEDEESDEVRPVIRSVQRVVEDDDEDE